MIPKLPAVYKVDNASQPERTQCQIVIGHLFRLHDDFVYIIVDSQSYPYDNTWFSSPELAVADAIRQTKTRAKEREKLLSDKLVVFNQFVDSPVTLMIPPSSPGS